MKIKLERREFYYPILIMTVAITLLGIAFIYSTTHDSASSDLFIRQIFWMFFGLFLIYFLNRIDYNIVTRYSPALYIVILALLVLLLVAGQLIGGVKSWFYFRWISLQPSEFGKIVFILFLSKYISELGKAQLSFKDIIKPSIYLALPLGLIALQPDLGSAITYIPIFFGIIFVARLRLRVIISLLLLFLIGVFFSWSYILKPYQKQRITTFLEPEKNKKEAGYQIYQSKIAIGSGGVWGKGYLKGTQSQLKFVPEQHTDFIFSVLAEETGFIGVLAAMGLYIGLILSFITTAATARDKLGLFIATGFSFLFAFHFFINVGMVVGLMPTTGIPLPLFSYGGSSLLSFYIGIGIVMSIRSRRFVYL